MLTMRRGEPVFRVATVSEFTDTYQDVNKACTRWLHAREGMTPQQRREAARQRFRQGVHGERS